MARENSQMGVEEVNGKEIKVGSLTEVSTSGNWPPIYDEKGANTTSGKGSISVELS